MDTKVVFTFNAALILNATNISANELEGDKPY